jgi:transcriptional regulator with XRE-family HTH domain
MNFEQMREWLARRLAISDDAGVAAGGTSMEALANDAEARTVTPAALAEAPTELGRVVRYVRERRGWSRRDLADLADMDEHEIESIESSTGPSLSPRSVVSLARVCQFSVSRLQQLANHVVIVSNDDAKSDALRFAARSQNVSSVSQAEFDAVRALVEVLSERAADQT